jgi:hypothetical protein
MAAALLTGLVLAFGLVACGSDGESDTNGGTGGKSKAEVETPVDAYQSGDQICTAITEKALKENFGVTTREEAAQAFVENVYVGNFPKNARLGCLAALNRSGLSLPPGENPAG